jgi:tetratricopeptide (TPR) repeat protein
MCLVNFAQSQDNPELKKMYEEDQEARQVANINWKILSREDSLREVRVYQMIEQGKLTTGNDYYHSAMIFQHGRDTAASAMAVRQMRKAIELDPNINKWLLAAAIDRDLMRRGQPQVYGTQYTKNYGETKWKRYQIDSTKVTDEERKYYGVETLPQQKIKERQMNLTAVSTYHTTSSSVDKTIEFIKREFKKGNTSAYNVSESGINEFGYQLMAEKKDEDALKIFKLNTELYPKGFNTFDSYGECLLKLNKKEEARKAYQKSLELNPKNDNARKMLAEMK